MNLITSCILFLFLISSSFSPLVSSSRDAYCSNTPFPLFCKSTLPNNRSASIHDYGRISFHRSLASTEKFLSLVNFYLRLPNAFSKTTILALQDCHSLASSNIDFLSSTLQNVAVRNTLHSWQADDLQTLLSATLTNQQTCLDGLETAYSGSTIRNALLTPISDGNMLYSVSLALFTHGWVHDHKKNRRWLTERKFMFSNTERKLLQEVDGNQTNGSQTVSGNQDASGNPANGSQTVVGSQDGSENQTTGSQTVVGNQDESGSQANGSQTVVGNQDGSGNQTTGNQTVIGNQVGSGSQTNGSQTVVGNQDGRTGNPTNGSQTVVGNQDGSGNPANGSQPVVGNQDGSGNQTTGNQSVVGNQDESGNFTNLVQVAANQVNVSQIVVVNQDGSGNFTNISDAVAAAPNGTLAGNGYFVIYIVAGVYEEYVSIAKNKQYLMMIGDGINQTIITGNHSIVDGWTTYNSATFAVTGEGFVAVNITIRNTAGAIKHQAVALRNGADLSTFYYCGFDGYQDTLYAHSLRQFYRNCDIYGTVDFIFGNAAAIFQNCNIFPRLPMYKQFNAITAQGRTDINQNTGTSIQNCTIVAAEDLALSNGTTRTYLGRPWKEYSRTVFMQSFIDGLVSPAGWIAWSGDFALNTSYYAEFNNSGSGSNTTDRVTWAGYQVINETDAANFTVSNFIQGDAWLPATGATYTGGLMT